MKFYLVNLLLLTLCFPAAAQQTNSQNYIITQTYKQSGADPNNVGLVTTQVQYFDGLGRPQQTVDVGQSPTGMDIVRHVSYDAYGRQDLQYLPYTAAGNGAYQPAAPAAVAGYYSSNIPGLQQINPSDLTRPYRQTFFEQSPLGRPVGSQEPGGRSNASQLQYKVNGPSEVKRYDYDPATNTIVSNGHYNAGTLQHLLTTDEEGNQSSEFRDVALDQLICRKVNTGTESLDTYYVYDDLGLLRAVLQPEYQTTPSNDFAFLYDYDNRARMIRKHIPGAGATEIVYDNFDRAALSRDANQTARGVWAFTKYDALNRPVMTGEIASTANHTSWTATVAAITAHHEDRSNGTTAGYSLNQTAPVNATEAHLLTITFYDDYGFQKPANLAYAAQTGYPASHHTAVKALMTGGRTRMLNTAASWLTHVVYYDQEYRPIQATRQLHDLGTEAIERVSTQYKYDLAPVVAQQLTQQVLSSSLTNSLTSVFDYDHADRLLQVRQTVTTPTQSKTAYTTAQRYNALGELQEKGFHGYDHNPHDYRRRTDYTYNIRGWLTDSKTRYGIYYEDPDQPFYAVGLEYTHPTLTGKYSAGNISSMEWLKKDETAFTSGMNFTYDGAGRLKAGSGLYGYADIENNITYDKNGNLKTLNRAGSAVDHLTYSYTGNRLSSLTDASGNNTGVKSGTSSYSYDANGNMLTDGNRSATLTYNYLNLPKTVTTGSKTYSYDYDAAGSKHQYAGDTVNIKYAGAFEYGQGNVLKRIAITDGQIVPSGDTLAFQYYLKDHLGNVRLVFDENGDVLQETDYYSFGLAIARDNPVQNDNARNTTNRYLYNEKELQTGTGYLDYGARMYMPEVGRWGAIDPMAEHREWLSPYNYVQNNPIIRVDPDGAFDFAQRQDGSIYWDKNANSQASTKQGETYLGTSLNFTFNSYIDGKLWDGPGGSAPVGDKLTSTITLTGSKNGNGELTGLTATKSVKIGDTPMGTANDYFPGLGNDQNKFGFNGTNLNFEQHASVSTIEAIGLGVMGYDIVNVAQKLQLKLSGNDLSVTAGTDVFPSATLSVNGKQLFQYNQPSFKGTHGYKRRTVSGDNGTGGNFLNEPIPLRPIPSFHIRYKK